MIEQDDDMKLLILSFLFAVSVAAPAAQTLIFHDDGSYRFYYETGEEGGSHSRSEVRSPDGVVIGKFSYQDPDGEIREVNYRADDSGFVAQGDVGVQGAPKGQFPAIQKHQSQEPIPVTSVPTVQQSKEQPKLDDEPQAENTQHEPHHDDDDMQDLTFDESATLDAAPEGFPPGFFLQKYHGLRRLPEPTKKPSTTEFPKQDKTDEQGISTQLPSITKEPKNTTEPAPTDVNAEEPKLFAPLKPFQGLTHQEWASTMFHQPVYVFAYNQPDSYGYHYYF